MALLALNASPATGQTPTAPGLYDQITVPPPPEQIFDQQVIADDQLIAEGTNRPGRFAEPPAPPFDYWKPTWMPCQTLRTNRSLVLGHLWFGMDLMAWSTKGVHAPPLLANAQNNVLFGDEFLHNEMRPGGKLTIGWWFDPNQYSGIEFNYLELDGKSIDFTSNQPNLFRPVLEPGTGNAIAVPSTAAGLLEGDVRILSNLQLSSTGILYRDMFWAGPYGRLDYLVGYRHAHLYDQVKIIDSVDSLDAASGFDAGDNIRRVDDFRAINQFDGADFGLRGWWSRSGKLALTGLAKVAIGAANSNVIVNGYTDVNDGDTVYPGGVLALPSNMGRRAHQEFGVVSEMGLGLEWLPVCQVRVTLGYTWFYWSDVARAAAHIDRTVDTNQLAPGGAAGNRPAFDLQTTSFWAQGMNAGFVYEF
jgi:hypothetical protein